MNHDEEALGGEREEPSGPALALESAHLRAELARREQLGEVLATIVATITSRLDQQEIMTRVVTLAGEEPRRVSGRLLDGKLDRGGMREQPPRSPGSRYVCGKGAAWLTPTASPPGSSARSACST